MSATFNCGVCIAAEEDGQPEFAWDVDGQVHEWDFCFTCWTCVAHCRCDLGQSLNVDLDNWENHSEDEMYEVWKVFGIDGIYAFVNHGLEGLAELTPVEMTLFGTRDAYGPDRPYLKTVFEADRESGESTAC